MTTSEDDTAPTGRQRAQPAPGTHPRPTDQPPAPGRSGLLVVWTLVLVAAVAVGGLGIWAVRTAVYSPEAAAQGYHDALAAGRGGEVMGLLSESATADLAARFEQTDPPTDAGLLSGDALEHSTQRLEDLALEGEEGAPRLTFGYDGERHSVEVPVDSGETTWWLFDRWEITEEVVSEFEVVVPYAQAGGVERITVNEEPVDLDDGSVRLAAFLPSTAQIEAEGPWVSGTVEHLVLDDSDAELRLDVEPSEEAVSEVHDQVEAYLRRCADQQVLMPTGCPMGAQTPNQVDADTIEWTMPEASELEVTLDEEGWQVQGTEALTAQLEFEALDHFDGSSTQERFESAFSLDVEVEPVGEELRVSISGEDGDGGVAG